MDELDTLSYVQGAINDARHVSNMVAATVSSPTAPLAKRKAALHMLERIHALDPGPRTLMNIAVVNTKLGNYREAEEQLDAVLLANPEYLGAHHARGVLHLVMDKPRQAIDDFKRCIDLAPDELNHRLDLSMALLQAGLWADGFDMYETRKQINPERTLKGVAPWKGDPDPYGLHLYVWAEQGIGDTFQFSRYLPWACSRAKRVTFAVPYTLLDIFEPWTAYLPNLEVTAFSGYVPETVNAETSLMSLAHWSGTAFSSDVPQDPGYISVWAQQRFLTGKHCPLVRQGPMLKAGLVWACNPGSAHSAERSVPFEDMLTLIKLPQFEFYGLQVGERAADITAHQAQTFVTDLSPWILDDWSRTVTCIQQMDVVISTDTSVAHLAALMNKPTYMLLARRDWWRWGSDVTTPWYPTMNIARPRKPFVWDDALDQVTGWLSQGCIASQPFMKAA